MDVRHQLLTAPAQSLRGQFGHRGA